MMRVTIARNSAGYVRVAFADGEEPGGTIAGNSDWRRYLELVLDGIRVKPR